MLRRNSKGDILKELNVLSHTPARPIQMAHGDEPAFLLDCIRHFFRPCVPLPIPSDLDWAKLLEIANGHCVESLLYSVLRDGDPGVIPPAVLTQLQERLRETAHFNLALTAELAGILTSLDRAEIDVCTLKGLVLAEMLYGNVAMRSFADLDLLVHPRDFVRTKKVLEAGGYFLTSSLHWPCNSALLRARESQLSFENSRGVSVDVHWHLIPSYWPKPFDENDAWTGGQNVPLGGATGRTLSREQLLLFLCAHGARHIWARLGWVCDVARLIQVEAKMDWNYVFAQVRQTRTSRMLALGLRLASDLLGGELPTEAKEWLVHAPQTQELELAIRKRFLDCAPFPAPALEAARLSMRTCDRVNHRLRFLLGTLIGPSEAEYRALPMPPGLFMLYYLFRPLRLIAKYFAQVLTG
jgi:hypothetical protein